MFEDWHLANSLSKLKCAEVTDSTNYLTDTKEEHHSTKHKEGMQVNSFYISLPSEKN